MSPQNPDTRPFAFGGFTNRAALTADIERSQSHLRVIQRRLGTPYEELGDVDRAQDLMHRLNNLRTAAQLWMENEAAGGP